eukprot:gene15546-17426_t
MFDRRIILIVSYLLILLCSFAVLSDSFQSSITNTPKKYNNRSIYHFYHTKSLHHPRILAADVSTQQTLYSTSKDDLYSSDGRTDLTLKEKFKKLWKAYGIVLISTYLGIYISTLGSLFIALDLDLFNAASVGLDPIYAIHKFSDIIQAITGSSSVSGFIRDNPKVGTFAIAWVMTKFTEPLRLGLTIISVPTIAQMLGKKAADDLI